MRPEHLDYAAQELRRDDKQRRLRPLCRERHVRGCRDGGVEDHAGQEKRVLMTLD